MAKPDRRNTVGPAATDTLPPAGLLVAIEIDGKIVPVLSGTED